MSNELEVTIMNNDAGRRSVLRAFVMTGVVTGAALAVTVYSGIMYIVDGMRISKELDAQADGADQAPGEGEGASDEDGGPSEQDEDGHSGQGAAHGAAS